jgi:large subunit ribosomal protein L10
VNVLAISKQRKEEVINQYQDWFTQSKAIILVEYTGVTVKNLDAIRAKVRESGSEFHIVKNTLAKKVFEESGVSIPSGFFEKSTAAVFAFGNC